MTFLFINLVSASPVFILILLLLRDPIKAKKRAVILPLDVLSGVMCAGIVYDVLKTTNLSGNPLLWRVTNSLTGWHVLAVFGLVATALIVGIMKKSLFLGGMTAFFALGVHEAIWFPVAFAEGLIRGQGATYFLTFWNFNVWTYWFITLPIIPVYLYFYRVNLRFLVPIALFYAGWLIIGFPISISTPWSDFAASLWVAGIEIASWFVMLAAVCVSSYKSPPGS